ncbi:kinase-like protein [Polyporus arcularius HHB13444]|uniref:non-specific serine/threonine protein kinase n=1 Tax=Polyporus arcularius HHB13444 TaxID=1314778 RepID=A0A5C3P8C1_9APHY|nr:kinase-like protein [Polyporus arcularius HHB13444]
MLDRRNLPSYAYSSPEDTLRQAEQTRNGLYALLPAEKTWRDRQPGLQQRGYALRRRYQPNWQPSWMGTNINPFYCEDSVSITHIDIIDATRADGTVVAIKYIEFDDAHEVEIAQFLSSIIHPDNHCVPVLDAFPDPLDPGRTLLVMPWLRPFDDPEFVAVGEVIEFVEQMLKGLAFLHANFVVHRDIAPQNVMMDGSPLYPGGFHPIRRRFSPDAIYEAKPLSRMDHPVRYFYIDFGLSERFSPGASSLVVGDVGRDAEVPELSSTVPYDGYKADIYALGNLFYKEFVQKYHNVDFLLELIEPMKQVEPKARPSASELVRRFGQICDRQQPSSHRWRLGPRSEPAYERIFNDTVAVAWEGLSQLKRLVR